MIYLIGGAPRTGKSLLALKLLAAKPMSSLSCDFLYELDDVRNISGFGNADITTKARLFYPTLRQLLVNVNRRSEHSIIDGEVILPEFMPDLSKQYEIRCCFLGLSTASLDTIIAHGGYFNWPQWKLKNGFENEVKDLAERTISRSSVIQVQAQQYGVPYFDLAPNYDATMELAVHTLIS